MTEQITKPKAGIHRSRNLTREEWAKIIIRPQVSQGNKKAKTILKNSSLAISAINGKFKEPAHGIN